MVIRQALKFNILNYMNLTKKKKFLKKKMLFQRYRFKVIIKNLKRIHLPQIIINSILKERKFNKNHLKLKDLNLAEVVRRVVKKFL